MTEEYGYRQYRSQAVNTMTQSEMLLLLYDELVKRIRRAEMALEEKDYEVFEASVVRAKEIVHYLKQTLKSGFEVSRGLNALYDFFIFELSRAAAGRKAGSLKDVERLACELRDAFRQASQQTGK